MGGIATGQVTFDLEYPPETVFDYIESARACRWTS